MTTYYAIIAQGATGKVIDMHSLAANDFEDAKKEASQHSKGAHSHDVLHLCTMDDDGQHHSVAARTVCRDRWVDSYPIK